MNTKNLKYYRVYQQRRNKQKKEEVSLTRKANNIEEHNPMDTSKFETHPIHKEIEEQIEEHTKNEENVANQEKVDNTEKQKSQPIDTPKLETKQIHKEKQIDMKQNK